MNASKQTQIKVVTETLSAIPHGSLVWLDYVAAGKASAHAREVAEASRAAGIPPTHYQGEYRGFIVNNDGEPVLQVTVHNRKGELRRFNPFKGTLRAIRILREGPDAEASKAA